MAKFKLGQNVDIAGLDGCVVTGIFEKESGFFYEVKSTSTVALYPEESIKGGEPKDEVQKDPQVENEVLKPMTSEDI